MILRDEYEIRDALKIQEMLIKEGIWASIPEIVETWEDFSNARSCSWMRPDGENYWDDYVVELKEKISNER